MGRSWMILGLLCTAQFVDVIGVTLVVVALPVLRDELGLAAGDASWVVAGYALAFGGLLPVAGRAADRYGRRRLFMVGLWVFTGASLVCGVVRVPVLFLGARAVQGLGAALMVPAALSLLLEVFPEGARRARALGVWTAAGAVGGAAGFVVGGVLTEYAGWRWLFLGNVPIGLAGLVAAMRLLPRTGGAARGPLDVQGCVAVTGGIALLIHGCGRVEAQGFRPEAWAPLVGAAALLAWFVAAERRAVDPLVPFGVVTPRVAGALATAFTITATTGAGSVLAGLYLQNAQGLGAGRTGLLLLPISLAVVAGSALGGTLTGRGRPVAAACGGLLVIATALGCAAFSGVGFTVAGMALSGLGLGCASVAATAMGLQAIAGRDHGVVSGLLSAVAQIGTAVGVALLLALANAVTSTSHAPEPNAIAAGMSTALATASGIAVLTAITVVALNTLPRVLRQDP